MLKQRFKPVGKTACERNKELAEFRNYDMKKGGTFRVLPCDGEHLTVPEGDIEGLTQEELDSREEFETPEEIE